MRLGSSYTGDLRFSGCTSAVSGRIRGPRIPVLPPATRKEERACVLDVQEMLASRSGGNIRAHHSVRPPTRQYAPGTRPPFGSRLRRGDLRADCLRPPFGSHLPAGDGVSPQPHSAGVPVGHLRPRVSIVTRPMPMIAGRTCPSNESISHTRCPMPMARPSAMPARSS